jgi:phage terminase large subunit GpA-like protein
MVLIDERDRMDGDVGGEGDPVALAEARTATYPDGKVIVTSTPTLEGASPIWALYEQGTRFEWSWPCPECNAYFVPRFELLKWSEKATPAQAKRTARLLCPHCSALIEDKHRTAMNAAGRYETTGDPDSDCASFWVSGLASPWRSWGDCARSWIEAVRSGETSRMQAVKNTVFGELYKLQGEAPASAVVAALRGAYVMDECPTEARILTAGVDLQADRLVYVVRAWAERSTSWLIRHGEIYGDTLTEAPWGELAELLSAEWGGKRVRMMLVDSGYRPQPVYDFARRFPGRVLPSKGHDTLAKPVAVTALDTTARGKTAPRTARLAHVDAGYFKAFVHGRLAWPLDQPGAWHLPSDTTDDYCQQIVAEGRITKPNGRVIWVRTSKANHYLDAEALACAAAHLMGVHSLPKARATSTPAAAPKPAPIPAVARHPTREPWIPRRGSWFNRR